MRKETSTCKGFHPTFAALFSYQGAFVRVRVPSFAAHRRAWQPGSREGLALDELAGTRPRAERGEKEGGGSQRLPNGVGQRFWIYEGFTGISLESVDPTSFGNRQGRRAEKAVRTPRLRIPKSDLPPWREPGDQWQASREPPQEITTVWRDICILHLERRLAVNQAEAPVRRKQASREKTSRFLS